MITNQFKMIITLTAHKEIKYVYNYISKNLYSKVAAKRLMNEIEKETVYLKSLPKMYEQIKGTSNFKRIYRKVVINNYVLIYTVDDENKIVCIVHFYYSGKNYLDLI